MSNSLNIELNLNKKEKKMLLSSTESKMYVILQGSIFRCRQVGEINDILKLNEGYVKVEIVESLKNTNFKDILEKEVKYMDIDRRYNQDGVIYFILRFKDELSKNINILKNLVK